MSADIRLRHPGLPDEQTITVAEAALPHYAAAGWVRVDEPSSEPADDEPAEAPDADTPSPTAARKRRRTPEGE